jgi:hypothetical protein
VKTNVISSLLLAVLAVGSAGAADSPRPVIMLTGYWNPTGDMIRRFSRNPEQNPRWIGGNWEGRGYDVQSWFPEFPEGSGSIGKGDFQVEREDTRADFERITAEVRPIAILSFGQGGGPWEIETNATDYEHGRPVLPNTLPARRIADVVNALGELRAWVDRSGDAGSYLCGFLSRLGAEYHVHHPENLLQGFIHVEPNLRPGFYVHAVDATLRAVIERLDARTKRGSAWPSSARRR